MKRALPLAVVVLRAVSGFGLAEDVPVVVGDDEPVGVGGDELPQPASAAASNSRNDSRRTAGIVPTPYNR